MGLRPASGHNAAMRDLRCTATEGGGGRCLRLASPRGALSWADCLHGWRCDAGFRADFARSLTDSAFDAFRWECPPLTMAVLDQPFECVLIDAPELERAADDRDFGAHFRASSDAILRFANLSGDAELIVPRPLADTVCYPHLAAFLRKAPAAQIDALWRVIGEAVTARLDARPVWLSTAGDGVAWLHVRLDARPKYYCHAPYRSTRA